MRKPGSPRRLIAHLLALAVLLAPAAPIVLPPAAAAQAPAPRMHALDGSRSPQAWLAQPDVEVVVALFSLPGCPYCEVVRRNYLRHLVGEVRGLKIVEYGIGDTRAFDDAASGDRVPGNAAALAESLGVRLAPTVVFLGEDGDELAERLVGFSSPDFYGAYLDGGIARALERARAR